MDYNATIELSYIFRIFYNTRLGRRSYVDLIVCEDVDFFLIIKHSQNIFCKSFVILKSYILRRKNSIILFYPIYLIFYEDFDLF